MIQGNVVKWNNKYWVSLNNPSLNNDVADLIPIDSTNLTAHPSKTWPDDPEMRIDSVKFVAATIKDFMIKIVFKEIL